MVVGKWPLAREKNPMRKVTYFEDFPLDGWPSPDQLRPYFIAPPGQEWFYATGNDTAGLRLEGIEGTEQYEWGRGRIDLVISMWGHPKHGMLIMYQRQGEVNGEIFFTKGNMSLIRKHTRSLHDTPLPIGLFIPFAQAWLAVEDFILSEGGRSKRIEWISALDLPPDSFPDP